MPVGRVGRFVPGGDSSVPVSLTRRAFAAGESSRGVRPTCASAQDPSANARRVGVPERGGVPTGTPPTADMALQAKVQRSWKVQPGTTAACQQEEGACAPGTAPKAEPAPSQPRKPEREREKPGKGKKEWGTPPLFPQSAWLLHDAPRGSRASLSHISGSRFVCTTMCVGGRREEG